MVPLTLADLSWGEEDVWKYVYLEAQPGRFREKQFSKFTLNAVCQMNCFHASYLITFAFVSLWRVSSFFWKKKKKKLKLNKINKIKKIQSELNRAHLASASLFYFWVQLIRTDRMTFQSKFPQILVSKTEKWSSGTSVHSC